VKIPYLAYTMPATPPTDELIQHLTRNLGLVYLNSADTTGNVCYASEPTLRPEFRQSFTLQQVEGFLNFLTQNPALLQQYAGRLRIDDTGVVYPLSVEVFWEIADSPPAP
jgi:hypothetical protein